MAKATKVSLFLVLAMAKESLQNNGTNNIKFERNKVNGTTILQEMKYEYCVKIIMVCYLLWDSPPDYDDEEESLQIGHSAMDNHNNYASNQIDEEFRKARCIPNNLTTNELRSYWKDVRRWQQEVKKQFLNTNIFTLKEELDGGKAIKINLWSVFKIQMTVICNRTKGPDDSLSESTSSASKHNTFEFKEVQENCDPHQEIGIWINEQIKGVSVIEDITLKFANILEKPEMDMNRNCCPYAMLRDRIEIINDNIDTILHLKSLNQYERAESTGYAWLDVHNLLVRLEYLNQKTVNNGEQADKCCNNWEESVRNVKYRFQTEMKFIQSVPPVSSRSNQLTEFLNSLNQKLEYLRNRFLTTEKHYNGPISDVTTNDCCRSHTPLKIIEILINDFKFSEFKHNSTKDLHENVKSTSDTIESTQMILNTDQNQVSRLITMCSKICIHTRTTRINLKIKLRHLEEQVQLVISTMKSSRAAFDRVDLIYLNAFVNDGHNKLTMMDEKLDNILRNRVQGNLSHLPNENTIVSRKRSFDIYNDGELRNCLVKVQQQRINLRNLMLLYNANMESHRNTKIIKETVISNLNDNVFEVLKNLKRFTLNDILQLESYLSSDGKQYHAKWQIGKQSHEVPPILKKRGQPTYSQSQLAKGITNKPTKSSPKLMRTKSKAKKISKRRFKSVHFNSQSSNKLDYLEARLNTMTKQTPITLKLLSRTIEELENRLKMINNQINNSYRKAIKCSVDCNWSELKASKLKELEIKFLKTNKTTF